MLSKAGLSVGVYERDRTRTDWLQGYRIHINPDGSRALHECLLPAVWETLVATAGQASDGFGFREPALARATSCAEWIVGRCNSWRYR